MAKNLFFMLLLAVLLGGCTAAQIQQTLDTINNVGEITSAEAGNGLKEALNIGISKGADRLSVKDGYFKSAYKILLPPEARKVTERLRVIPGFTDVEDILLEKINRGAEDAATKAKPIFVKAITGMTFNDAMNILMGNKNAATAYLNSATYNELYAAFNPVIVQSLDKFDARKYWSDAVNAYNKIPFIERANPNLDQYVTNQALTGLFNMVEKEELNIRENISARTSDLLKRVFAKQDKK